MATKMASLSRIDCRHCPLALHSTFRFAVVGEAIDWILAFFSDTRHHRVQEGVLPRDMDEMDQLSLPSACGCEGTLEL